MNKIQVIITAVLLLFSVNSYAQFIKGADISWHTEQINAGYSWKDDNGYAKPLHDILKDHSMTAVRLRVWVNPANGWNNQADVVTKAVWAKNAGMDILIDFHYSDTWADPGNQMTPAAWSGLNRIQLEKEVGKHTRSVLRALRNNGVTPKWIQIGNETNDGMLWPHGRPSTDSLGFTNYANYVRKGNQAAKHIFPNVKTILHLANAENLSVLEWNIDGLLATGKGDNWDIIGLSLYPESNPWWNDVNAYIYNLNYLKNKYNKDVMLVEVGLALTTGAEGGVTRTEGTELFRTSIIGDAVDAYNNLKDSISNFFGGDDVTQSSSASGGFVLYPSKPNNNKLQRVYTK